MTLFAFKRRDQGAPRLALLIAVPAALGLSGALAAPLDVRLSLMAGDQPMAGTVTTPGGQTLAFDFLRMYVSNVALVRADGSEVPVLGLTLTEFKAGGPMQNVSVFKGDAPVGEYRGLRFDVGVPRDLNHLDASAQSAPLGLDSGMFWAWNPGYIFFRFEGKAKLGNQSAPIALHMGEDARRLTVNLADVEKPSVKLNVTDAGAAVNVQLDLNKYVASGVNGEPFDLSQAKYQQVHGGPVADQLYLNLQSAFNLAAPAAVAGK